MTSSGDPGKVKKAKDVILYGIIGLIVCALAFAIVNFVVGNLGGGSSNNYVTTQVNDNQACLELGGTFDPGTHNCTYPAH